MALEKAGDPKVKDLAQRIADAQQPEIDQMQGWLDDGTPPPPPSTTGDTARA